MANAFERFPYRAGMRLMLRKPHPCGGRIWRLERIGADARLVCETCGRSLMMPRRALEKATRSVCPEAAAEALPADPSAPNVGAPADAMPAAEQSMAGGAGQP